MKATVVIIWILAVLLALGFLGSGITKLMGVEMQVKNFDSWGYPQWLRYPIGITEIIFAIGLLLPAYRRLVIYGIFVWGVIAVITHLQAGQANMVMASLLFCLLAAIMLILLNKTERKMVQ